MISDHVESNMTPISDFTNCNANHCPYSKLHDFGPCKIDYIFRYDTKSFTNPSANLCPIPILPPAMPTSGARAVAMAAARRRWQRREEGGGNGACMRDTYSIFCIFDFI